LTPENIYVSSGAFQSNTLSTIAQQCIKTQIKGLELGANIRTFSPELDETLAYIFETNKINLLIHNYFPPPKTPFVLNLGSSNKDILEKSLNLCMRAIKMCDRYNIPFYSVHAGFCFDALPEQLGQKFTSFSRISFHKAENIFIESLKNLSDYAAGFDIGIAVENNVLAPFNLVNGRNELLLGVAAKDLVRYIEKAERSNLFILLDVGHLKVTSMSLKLNPYTEMEAIAPFVRAVHLSENNGYDDVHGKTNNDSWFWKPLRNLLPNSTIYILEAYQLEPTELLEQVKMIKRNLTKNE
jgi:sugar phosphate isomerase/epimerase